MKKVNLLLAAVVAASVSAPAVADFTPNTNFFGYMRAGVGFDKDGKFKSLETNKLGRLGNESNLYGEIGIGADVAKIDDTVWSVGSMLAVTSSSPNSWVGLGDGSPAYDSNNKYKEYNGKQDPDGEIALEQFYVEVKGLLDFDKDAKIWVGKKFVQREDIHITDDYYYNISGNGFGIYDLSLGSGKFQASYVQNANKKNVNYENVSDMHSFDVRYAFPLWDGANFQIGNVFAVEKKQTRADQVLNGNMLTLEFTQGFNGGWNKTVFQWKKGAMLGQSGTGWGQGDDLGDDDRKNLGYKREGNGFKLYNFCETTIVGDLHMFHVFAYEYSNYDEPWHLQTVFNQDKKVKDLSIVIRPWYKLTKMTRVYAELGMWAQTTSTNDMATGKANEDNNNRAQKVTLAYAITPDAGNFWSRPEIRFFGTWLHGDTRNGGDKYNNSIVGSHRGGSVDMQVGAQVEAWW